MQYLAFFLASNEGFTPFFHAVLLRTKEGKLVDVTEGGPGWNLCKGSISQIVYLSPSIAAMVTKNL